MFATQQSLLAQANDETLALYTRLEALQRLQRELKALEQTLLAKDKDTS